VVTISQEELVARLPAPRLLVGGQWTAESEGGRFTKRNPANGCAIAEIPLAGPSDVDVAVDAAVSAFPGWRDWPTDARRNVLFRISQLLSEHADEFGLMASLESGLPRVSTAGMAHLAAEYFLYYGGWVDKLGGEVVPIYPGQAFDYTRPEPYGVVGVIIPWNGPTVSLGQTVAPALAAGNCVVLKPSELAPFTSLRFAGLCEQAGLPPGVLNVIIGGAPAGEALVAHIGVDKVSFTGGVETGKRVQEVAARNLTPVTLELGGKSANLVFADADLDRVFTLAIFGGAIGAAGQGCVCPTRLLVERSVYEQAIERILEIANAVQPGDPTDPDVYMGPVITEAACERILEVVSKAVDDGAGELLTGGHRLGGDLADGYYVATTIFGNVDNHSDLAQREIFGPVLAVASFDDEDEAVSLANDTRYGLAGYVNTTDLRRAHHVAARLEAGYIGVNGMPIVPPAAPFGGTKDSGYGRQGGRAGLMEFVRVKNIFMEGV
jgi:acyl-CoA reductase-like NAD-dependent aldehyde dehydrogenase